MIRLISRILLARLLKNRLSSSLTFRLGWFTDPVILITTRGMKYKTQENSGTAEKYFTMHRVPAKDRQDRSKQEI